MKNNWIEIEIKYQQTFKHVFKKHQPKRTELFSKLLSSGDLEKKSTPGVISLDQTFTRRNWVIIIIKLKNWIENDFIL